MSKRLQSLLNLTGSFVKDVVLCVFRLVLGLGLASNAVRLFGRCLESLHNVVYKFLQETGYKFIKIVARGWIALLYSDVTPDLGTFRLNIA